MQATDPPLDLDDIQAILLSGYGDLPRASFLMLSFGEPDRARDWIGERAGQVASAGQGRPESEARVHLAFTWPGLEHLGLSWQALKGFSREFREGIAGSSRRSRILGDSGESAPANWRWGGPEREGIHALLMGYAATPEALVALLERERKALDAAGIRVVEALDSQPLADGREHFGFRDGISQPKLVGVSSSRDARQRVAPGEFILGYANARDQITMRPLVDPIEDPDKLLPEVDEDSDLHDLGRNGSYLVFRQLSQDVPRFWNWLDGAASSREERLALAAKMVGRWPDGEPLVKAPERPGGERGDNDFGYHHEDAEGLKCPLGAHIRRTNPRDMLPPKPGSEESLAINHRHRLLRRGRSYGPPLAESLAPDDLLATGDDGQERGLHFLCLNADISRQFEFVQHTWVDNANFAGLQGETDPLIGERGEGQASFTLPDEPVRRRHHDLPRFVQVRGGAYFFLPGLRALSYLAASPRGLTTAVSAPDAPATLLPETWWLRTGRALNAALESGVALSRRATRLRNGFDRLFQRPATEALQWWILHRRKRHAIDADLAIAEERRLPGEEEIARRITEQMTAFLLRTYRHDTAERAGNTKTHGLLAAEFEVLDLPPELRCGLFAEPRRFDAWVRFGGPGPRVVPDIRDNGVLSLGVKVTGVPGETLLDDEPHTQDFSGISAPTFTTPDVHENAKLQRLIGAGLPTWYFLNPFDSHYIDMLLQALYAKAHGSPFEVDYWSCVPYLYGKGRAIKYRFVPLLEHHTRVPLPAPDDYLRRAMVSTLEDVEEVVFELRIQFQEDPVTMPIEDASVIWTSPETPVARLHIPRQAFDTPERDRLAREVTINPWHALPEHRPLGNQNRARKLIYYETSRVRQRINGEQHFTP
jgi:Dyp-type peroxidase family